MSSRTLRRVHLYLGSLFAPILLFFAVSGAWQVYRWNDAKKDGSYMPSRAIELLSSIHKNQTTNNKETPRQTALKAFVFAAAGLLVVTTFLGIVMAFQFTARPVTVLLCLLAGILVPPLLLFLSK